MQDQTIKPRLLLNFDLNGTLILKDTSKKASDEYMLISTLAENTFAKWDERYEPMSFKQYVYNVLLPGDKSNVRLKKERQKIVATFLQWLSEKSHPAMGNVLDDYHKIKNKFTDSKTKEINFTVFPSFYVMLEKLRNMKIPFIIILRTFGTDLPEVVKEIGDHDLGVKITHWAKFEDINFNTEGEKTIKKVEEIFDVFLSSDKHFAIQDDWLKWNQDGERGRSGKPFLYDISGKGAIKNLSLFFDDNITGEEQDIVRPCEIAGKNAPTKSLCERLIFPVNTKEAMLNDDYYIDRILQAIRHSEATALIN